ncbi:Beta-tubulin folding cofactor C [Trachipleistophora hominis]|uniref:Beta-tubulin folding cofactor C n=1 Tax=Trachipleistophora hominis TaxID=72359 RepID=L7JZH5_TRAHO|nr:Beta-tubulin folding cofactor C [Trachipleistophora hominis]
MEHENKCNTKQHKDTSNREVKSQIIILTNKLRKEKVKYRQNVLQEQIKKLKELYVQNDEYDTPVVCDVAKLDIYNSDEIDHSGNGQIVQNGGNYSGVKDPACLNDKIVFLDENNVRNFRQNEKYSKVCITNMHKGQILAFDCDELTLKSCNNLNITANVSDSIFIEDVRDSTLKINAGQIRLLNCGNMRLVVYTKSGISIEKSEQIIIEEWKIQNMRHKNLFMKVNDFSDPFGSKNYTVIC